MACALQVPLNGAELKSSRELKLYLSQVLSGLYRGKCIIAHVCRVVKLRHPITP